jgi:hypothetical protein
MKVGEMSKRQRPQRGVRSECGGDDDGGNDGDDDGGNDGDVSDSILTTRGCMVSTHSHFQKSCEIVGSGIKGTADKTNLLHVKCKNNFGDWHCQLIEYL